MSLEFPPPFEQRPQDREFVNQPISASRTFEGNYAGIHLVINGKAYFVKKDDARRVARKILFNED